MAKTPKQPTVPTPEPLTTGPAVVAVLPVVGATPPGEAWTGFNVGFRGENAARVQQAIARAGQEPADALRRVRDAYLATGDRAAAAAVLEQRIADTEAALKAAADETERAGSAWAKCVVEGRDGTALEKRQAELRGEIADLNAKLPILRDALTQARADAAAEVRALLAVELEKLRPAAEARLAAAKEVLAAVVAEALAEFLVARAAEGGVRGAEARLDQLARPDPVARPRPVATAPPAVLQEVAVPAKIGSLAEPARSRLLAVWADLDRLAQTPDGDAGLEAKVRDELEALEREHKYEVGAYGDEDWNPNPPFATRVNRLRRRLEYVVRAAVAAERDRDRRGY